MQLRLIQSAKPLASFLPEECGSVSGDDLERLLLADPDSVVFTSGVDGMPLRAVAESLEHDLAQLAKAYVKRRGTTRYVTLTDAHVPGGSGLFLDDPFVLVRTLPLMRSACISSSALELAAATCLQRIRTPALIN